VRSQPQNNAQDQDHTRPRLRWKRSGKRAWRSRTVAATAQTQGDLHHPAPSHFPQNATHPIRQRAFRASNCRQTASKSCCRDHPQTTEQSRNASTPSCQTAQTAHRQAENAHGQTAPIGTCRRETMRHGSGRESRSDLRRIDQGHVTRVERDQDVPIHDRPAHAVPEPIHPSAECVAIPVRSPRVPSRCRRRDARLVRPCEQLAGMIETAGCRWSSALWL
jgi:hypothetical protein